VLHKTSLNSDGRRTSPPPVRRPSLFEGVCLWRFMRSGCMTKDSDVEDKTINELLGLDKGQFWTPRPKHVLNSRYD